MISICKARTVALSLAYANTADYLANPGALGGNGFVGDVVEVGEQATRFRVGDHVFAVVLGLNPCRKTSGAFAEYSLITADLP